MTKDEATEWKDTDLLTDRKTMTYFKDCEKLKAENGELKRKLGIAQEALQFYTGEGSYEVAINAGRRAESALKTINEEMKDD